MSHQHDRLGVADVRLRLDVSGAERADAPTPGQFWTLVDSFEREGSLYIVAREARSRATGIGALTPRERQILLFLARGLTTKEAAFELRVSDATVRVLVGRAAAKLGTSSRAELLSHPDVQRLREGA